ncbi:MAG: hypothetical protein HC805_08310 [Alkalinema sp. RL_2_19]|nr:hypothetical protein [Alkalinema sp. RL_2_19]
MSKHSILLRCLQASWHKLTIGILCIVLAGCLQATPLHAEGITAKPDAGYLEGVLSMYEQAKTAPDSPSNRAFQSVLDQLFKPAAVQIPFRFVSQKRATDR